MIQAAERSNQKTVALKQEPDTPPVAAVKELLDQDRLGKIIQYTNQMLLEPETRLLPKFMEKGPENGTAGRSSPIQPCCHL